MDPHLSGLPVAVPEMLEVKEESDTEDHLTTMKNEISATEVGPESLYKEESGSEDHLTTIKSETDPCPMYDFPVVVPESLEVKSEREEPDTEGHLTTIKTEIVTSDVEESCFNASHPDWIPDRSSPQNLILVKTEDCSRSLGVSQEVSEEDFEFEFPDLEQFKARKAARTKENLSSINVLNPREKPYTCTECGKSYKLKWNFQVHRKTHKGEKPHESAEGDCLHHQKTPRDEKSYTCTERGKSFRDKDTLHTHHTIHTGEKPYTCTECGKRFTQRASLLRHHHTVHTGEKPFTCTECGKKFRDKHGLRTHHRFHTGEKPFRCTECGRRFPQMVCLLRHHRVHTGEKPYICTECGKRFTQRAAIVTHHRIHTGEKRFTCTECGKSFRGKGTLHKHHMLHTGEKPFKCTECGKRFRQSAGLHCHLETHRTENIAYDQSGKGLKKRGQ